MKKYVFEFKGTKEEFIKKLDTYPKHNYYDGNKRYIFDDYIVNIIGSTIQFGIERCGHSGGNWFIPYITEFEDRIEICGTIEYMLPVDNRSKFKKTTDKIQEIFLYIVLGPLVLLVFALVKLISFIKWMIRKICHKPDAPKPKTTEEKLFNLMENYFGCVRMESD
ncbi:MAG: hypothetical protein IKV30_00970 [Clostridia bacterium]|nr:hypothetical protein [Clostridia bacterium]